MLDRTRTWEFLKSVENVKVGKKELENDKIIQTLKKTLRIALRLRKVAKLRKARRKRCKWHLVSKRLLILEDFFKFENKMKNKMKSENSKMQIRICTLRHCVWICSELLQ